MQDYKKTFSEFDGVLYDAIYKDNSIYLLLLDNDVLRIAKYENNTRIYDREIFNYNLEVRYVLGFNQHSQPCIQIDNAVLTTYLIQNNGDLQQILYNQSISKQNPEICDRSDLKKTINYHTNELPSRVISSLVLRSSHSNVYKIFIANNNCCICDSENVFLSDLKSGRTIKLDKIRDVEFIKCNELEKIVVLTNTKIVFYDYNSIPDAILGMQQQNSSLNILQREWMSEGRIWTRVSQFI